MNKSTYLHFVFSGRDSDKKDTISLSSYDQKLIRNVKQELKQSRREEENL